MRRQRIYFRNTGHGGCQGRSYGTSGSNQIAVRIGFPHQLLGNDVHHRISIGNNGVQFLVKTVLHDLRKHFPVHLVSLLETHVLQILVRVLDDRRILVRMDR